jgi:hypothetical protein
LLPSAWFKREVGRVSSFYIEDLLSFGADDDGGGGGGKFKFFEPAFRQ